MSSTGRGIFLPALADMRRRWLLVATLAAAAAGAAAAFSFTATKRYHATATFVVAPVEPSDPTLLGIDVLHDSSRRTAAQTAARLIVSPEIAEAVRVRLGLRSSRNDILDSVEAKPGGTSNLVDVTATDTDSGRAAQLANGFVDAFVTARTAAFQSQVASALRRVQARLTALPPNRRLSPEGAELQRRSADMRVLIGTSDPTIRHGSTAVAPASAAWPHPVAWTIYAGVLGLAAGALLALLLGLAAAARRRDAVVEREYDSAVPERIVARLEKRLTERVDELAAERERLAARDAALAVRERDVTEKIDELRALAAAAPTPPAQDEPSQEAVDHGARLSEETAQLARDQAELARAGTELADEQAKLAEREARLDARIAELTERERMLARRSAELKMLESRLEREGADAERRAEDLAAREAELAATPPPAPPPAPAAAAWPSPAPSPVPPGPVIAGDGWHLHELERLVADHGASNPDRVEEWNSYLFYLREYADTEGRVPRQFDWLIEDAFGELVAAR